MNINVIAKSTFAILAVVALVAVVAYVQTGTSDLLNFAKSIAMWLIIGSVAIAIAVHGRKFLR